MRFPTLPCGAAFLAVLALSTAPLAAQSRGDAQTWRLGLNGGVLSVRTQTQDATMLPMAGAHLHIMANRTALMLGVDEAFGADEEVGLVRFNDIRRYQAVLLAHPFDRRLEPYFGVGIGIHQVVRPRVADIVTDPTTRANLLDAADRASTAAYLTALGGIQGRWGRFTAFGQYQIGSAPTSDKLLRGVTHSIVGGIRIGLGSSQDDLRRSKP